ncbi:MAG TPA: DUF58 domain-containing protein [Cytophagales bacterium]|nr:DUF58 domain-containing protein [Cytophagales bacterium]
MKELLKKLHRYEIKIRKMVTAQMQGDFHSVFKGSGLEFNDVRPYQYGDDVRTIHWNVSAKGHGTFVKTFREEKEQIVFFVLDVSASQDIGGENLKKLDLTKELCGVLTLSAIKEQSKVGVVCFSDQKESYIKPDKGLKYAYNIIYKIYNLVPKSRKTSLKNALKFVLGVIKKRSVIIVISDFIDKDYQYYLKAVAKKHDLVVIHINDKRERTLPSLGIIPIFDKEKNRTTWINTSFGDKVDSIKNFFQSNKSELESICKRYKTNYLSITTGTEYVGDLIKLFKVRNKK